MCTVQVPQSNPTLFFSWSTRTTYASCQIYAYTTVRLYVSSIELQINFKSSCFLRILTISFLGGNIRRKIRELEGGGCSGPVSERSPLLYDIIKRKRYISSRPPIKNILELFGASFNKTRLRRSWQGSVRETRPRPVASHSTIPLTRTYPTTASEGGPGLLAPPGRSHY